MSEEILKLDQQFGPYHILKKLGSGGMGTVYLADDHDHDRQVALKVAHPSLIRDEIGAHRFEREARAMARIEHENFIRVYDAGSIDKVSYYAMEVIHGKDLDDYMIAPKLSVTDWKEKFFACAEQIAKALAYIHARNMVHRDLKPSNILLNAEGEVKIMDFGLVKETDGRTALTAAGSILGTAHYMSPEQGKGVPVDPRSDLYSFGTILYEMATRQRVFEGETMVAIIFQHLQQAPRPPREHNPDLHPGIEKIILKLLEKEPVHRYQNAEEVLADLLEIKQEFLTSDESDLFLEAAEQSQNMATALDTMMTAHDGDSASEAPTADASSSKNLFQTPLVGRDKESKKFREFMEEALGEDEPGGFILVGGELGVGKTRLAQEIISDFQAKGHKVYTSRTPNRGGVSLQAFATLFDNLVYELKSRPKEEVAKLLGANGPIIARIFPGVASLLEEQEEPVPLSPDEEWIRALASIKSFLGNILDERPLVFFIENLQWMDDSSIDLLRFLAENLGEDSPHAYGLVIIGTVRTEEVEKKSPFRNFQRQLRRYDKALSLELERLGKEAVREFVTHLFGKIDLDDTVLERIFRDTNGNPYFVTEIVRSLVDDQMIVQRSGRWEVEATLFDGNVMPLSIQDVISRRLEVLDEEERDVLSCAAVIGEEFDFDTLLEISRIDEDDLIDLTDSLVKGQMIEDRSDRSGEKFIFHQNKVRDLLYNELNPRKRKRYHKKIGGLLEKTHKKNLQAVYAKLAFHFDQGGDAETAFRYYHLAGKQEKEAFLNVVAMNHLQTAIERFEKESEDWDEEPVAAYAECLLTLSQVYILVGDYEKAAATYGKLKEQKGLSKEIQAKAYWGMGEALFRLSKFDESADHYQQYLAISEELNDLNGMSEGRMGLGNLRLARQEYDAAKESYALALEPGEENLDPNLAARLHCNLGGVHYYQREYEQSRDHFSKAIEIARAPGAESVLSLSLNNHGAILDALGERQEAFKRYTEALEVARRIGKRSAQGMSLLNIGIYWKELGNSEKAVEALQEAFRLKKELGDKRGQARSLSEISSILFHRGNYEECVRNHAKCLTTYEELEDKLSTAISLANLADVHLTLGKFDEALESYERALAICAEIGDRRVQSLTLTMKAYTFALLGEAKESQKLLAEARRLATEPKELKEPLLRVRLYEVLSAQERGDYEQSLCGDEPMLKEFIGPDLTLAQLACGMGRYYRKEHEQAEALLTPAYEASQHHGHLHYLFQAEVYLGATIYAKGDKDLGRETLEKGIQRFETLAERIRDKETSRDFRTRSDRMRMLQLVREVIKS